MKKLFFSLICLIAASSTFAQKNEKQEFSGANGLKFTINTTLYEFKQEVVQDVPPTAEYILTNTGVTPLIITAVRPGCGCTKPEYPTAPIMPGQSGVVKGAYNAKAVGPFMKNMSIAVDGLQEQVVVYLQGTVKAK